jgi:hypothetical protein
LPVPTNVHGPVSDVAVACSTYLVVSFFRKLWYVEPTLTRWLSM